MTAVPHEGTKLLTGSALTAWRVAVALVVAVPFVGMVAAVLFWWNRGITVVDLILFAAFYLVTGFGITIGYHRLFAHQSFTATRGLRLALALAGSMAVQGPILRWVADHRRHHRFSDRPGDPHSPNLGEDDERSLRGLLLGLWYAHIGWFFDAEKASARRYAADLVVDPIIRRVDTWYPLWVTLSLALPAALGAWIHGRVAGGVSGLLFAGFARIFVVQHVTWSVNSVCHTFGRSDFATRDQSRNHWLMALLALGEGWHNNHHAFPSSSRQGLGRWQLDLSWLVIVAFSWLGIARGPRVPRSTRLAARAVAAAGGLSRPRTAAAAHEPPSVRP